MPAPPLTILPATPADLEAVVDLHARSRAACLPFLPVLHGRDEDLAFFGGYIGYQQMLLARRDGQLLGFMAVVPGWIEQLYLDPQSRRQGVGRALVDRAKTMHETLQLWCFAQNSAALVFYAAQDFVTVGGSDGDNEAGLADILLRWQRPS